MGRFLNYVDQHSDLMCRMMERLEIDIAASAGIARGTVLAGAARSCFFCRQAGRCQAWLDSGAKGASYRAFCPNACRFDGLPRVATGANAHRH